MSNEQLTSKDSAKQKLAPCPTRGGAYVAYLPEYLDVTDGKWKRVPTHKSAHGVPQPLACGGINTELDLCGNEQAWALAWSFAAAHQAQGIELEIRVAVFDVVYDLRATRKDEALFP